jgi:hypothetical protein
MSLNEIVRFVLNSRFLEEQEVMGFAMEADLSIWGR